MPKAERKPQIEYMNDLLRPFFLFYSYRRLSTGFAVAARIACQLTVSKAIVSARPPASANIHQPREIKISLKKK